MQLQDEMKLPLLTKPNQSNRSAYTPLPPSPAQPSPPYLTYPSRPAQPAQPSHGAEVARNKAKTSHLWHLVALHPTPLIRHLHTLTAPSPSHGGVGVDLDRVLGGREEGIANRSEPALTQNQAFNLTKPRNLDLGPGRCRFFCFFLSISPTLALAF